jgi:hypothetical protein
MSTKTLASVISIALALVASPTYAQTATWTGSAGDNQWTTANNWDIMGSPGVPCFEDAGVMYDVLISAPAAMVGLDGGELNALVGGTTCTINSLTINSPAVNDEPVLTLAGGARLTVGPGDVEIAGIWPPPFTGENRPLGGTTPPVLRVYADSTSESTLDANGNISLGESSGIQIVAEGGGGFQRGTSDPEQTHYHIELTGNWNNSSRTLGSFNLNQAAMLLDGDGAADGIGGNLQQFEVASRFSCGRQFTDPLALETLAIQSGAEVDFIDDQDNRQDGPLPPEIQATRHLGLGAAPVKLIKAAVVFQTVTNDGASISQINGGILRSAPAACPVQSTHAVIALALAVAVAGAIAIRRRRSVA